MQIHDLTTGALLAAPEQPDICGLGTLPDGFLFTTGAGVVGHADGDSVIELARHTCQWDNHLVRLS
jgi:hypothetical protein